MENKMRKKRTHPLPLGQEGRRRRRRNLVPVLVASEEALVDLNVRLQRC
jgi:hypothetical protein